jgi:hypothetical protein
VAESASELVDLLDLKLLPAWVKEPAPKTYADYQGESARERERPGERPFERRRERPPRRDHRPKDRHQRHRDDKRREPARRDRPERDRPPPKPLEVDVRFLPQPRVLEAVAAQIKADALAYSLFSLARLFLQKPERYDVRLTAKPDSPLYRLGENGAVAADRQFLETNAFRFAQNDFYKIDISQSEPIKGNFTSVARDPLSGTLLGPTNHHTYQPRLRSLYEQRFRRRMSFADYQRQIEIVTDPVLVEKWKEEARTVTTFGTLSEETAETFQTATEAEKHFRQKYLPGLVRATEDVLIDGITSRTLADRALRRLVEDAWSAETRSPSKMMPELAARLREAGLHVFRHRRGMLFVSPIRPRAFVHEETSVSPQVKEILETIAATRQINRKDLADKLLVNLTGEESEARKLALASDLRWLIGEGYVIEFNDGSLDLPRVKPKAAVEAAVSAAENSAAAASDNEGELVGSRLRSASARQATESRLTDEAEIGGS